MSEKELQLENVLLKRQIEELNERLYTEEYDKKVTITFNNPDEARLALRIRDFVSFNDEVWQKVWRPNNKWGYNTELLNKEESYEVIEELMKIYNDLMEEYNLRGEDLL